jgi:hypothetical protein
LLPLARHRGFSAEPRAMFRLNYYLVERNLAIVTHRWQQGLPMARCGLFVRTQVQIKETAMNVRSGRSGIKRPNKDQGKGRSAKPEVQGSEWDLADERLDEALRQTFPASDALSIIQNVRGS